MRTESHLHRSYTGGRAAPARRADKCWPGAHPTIRPELSGRTAAFGRSGPLDPCEEMQPRVASRRLPARFVERLHEELDRLASWLRAGSLRHDSSTDEALKAFHVPMHPTDMDRHARSDERTSAFVEASDADYVVVVAHRPSGRQGFRLPLALFSTPPRPGTRVSIVLSSEPFHALERQHAHHQAQPPQNLSHLTPEKAPVAETALDRAYDELDALLAERHVKGPDPELEKRIEATWTHLDALQEDLCAVVREELNASVQLPPDELARMLVEVQRRLNDEEDT